VSVSEAVIGDTAPMLLISKIGWFDEIAFFESSIELVVSIGSFSTTDIKLLPEPPQEAKKNVESNVKNVSVFFITVIISSIYTMAIDQKIFLGGGRRVRYVAV